jgi:hypothetical protein
MCIDILRVSIFGVYMYQHFVVCETYGEWPGDCLCVSIFDVYQHFVVWIAQPVAWLRRRRSFTWGLWTAVRASHRPAAYRIWSDLSTARPSARRITAVSWTQGTRQGELPATRSGKIALTCGAPQGNRSGVLIWLQVTNVTIVSKYSQHISCHIPGLSYFLDDKGMKGNWWSHKCLLQSSW